MGTIRFTWWNLQNFFDTDDDPISADLEFTVAKGWTPEVFAAKKAKLAEALKSTHDGEEIELLASRGLLSGNGLTLDIPGVAICRNELVATREGRPRGFDRKTRTGTSDHLPVTAVLTY